MVLCVVLAVSAGMRRITLTRAPFISTLFDGVLCLGIIVEPSTEKESLCWTTKSEAEILGRLVHSRVSRAVLVHSKPGHGSKFQQKVQMFVSLNSGLFSLYFQNKKHYLMFYTTLI
jgi:hypothetical protein